MIGLRRGSTDEIEIVGETPVLLCRRRGGAIDLLLDRSRLVRSQFVFTRLKGREAIFWQTQKTARAANPGVRIPADTAWPGRSRSPSTRTTATPSSAPAKEPRPSGRPPPPATSLSTTRTERSSRQSNGRRSRNGTPTGRLPFKCNASPNLRSPRSSSKPEAPPYSSSSASTGLGSPTNSRTFTSASPTSASSTPTPADSPKTGSTASLLPALTDTTDPNPAAH